MKYLLNFEYFVTNCVCMKPIISSIPRNAFKCTLSIEHLYEGSGSGTRTRDFELFDNERRNQT